MREVRHEDRGHRWHRADQRETRRSRSFECAASLSRDLLRGQTTRLPSGEAIARLLGAVPLTTDELGQNWPHGTPLWFYILTEAEHRGDGDRLGPVGGRIVAEVLIGLLRADPASYLSLEPDWEPELPAAGSGFGLADLLTFGVHRDGLVHPA